MTIENFILLRNGTWQAMEGRVSAEGKTQDLLKVFGGTSTEPVWLPHAEMACVLHLQLGMGRQFYLMYLEPRPRLVFFQPAGKEAKGFSIIFPHTYLGVLLKGGTIASAYGFVTKTPLTALNQAVGVLMIPNVNPETGRVCDSTGAEQISKMSLTPADKAGRYARTFFKTSFTSGMGGFWKLMPPPLRTSRSNIPREQFDEYNLKTLALWEEFGKRKGADRILKLRWPLTHSLEKVLQNEDITAKATPEATKELIEELVRSVKK